MTELKWKAIKWVFFILALSAIFGFLARQERVIEIAPKLSYTPRNLIKVARAETGEIGAKSGKNTPKVALLPSAEIVSKLMECENRDRKTDLVIMDRGSYSYGVLQFKKGTLLQFTRRYGLRTEITEQDLINPALQIETAKRMLEENPQNWRHWYNCGKKIGLDKWI